MFRCLDVSMFSVTFDICPGTKVATCDVNRITRLKKTQIGLKFVCRPFFTRAR